MGVRFHLIESSGTCSIVYVFNIPSMYRFFLISDVNSTSCVLFVVKLLLFLFCFDSCGQKCLLVDLLLACMPFLIFNFPLGLIEYTVILIYC